MNEVAPLLSVRGITKRFGGFTAVDKMSFDLKPGAIGGLIGPNGAGKTTLIQILTGALSFTQGEASFFGLQLSKDMQKIKKTLGVCPQFDTLWEDMTPYEHLKLFCLIKGLTDPE